MAAPQIKSGKARALAVVSAKRSKALLEVASGRRTWAERWKLHNALVLFNPAPVT